VTIQTLDPSADSLERFCAVPGLGELTPSAVRVHAPDLCLTVEQDKIIHGRCSLWWRDPPALEHHRVGCIGHYAAATDTAGGQLLEGACRRLREAGCTLAVGPLDGSTWRRYRLLTERGGEPPYFLEPDNPDDWPAHFERAGFTALAQYYSSRCDDISLLAGRAWVDRNFVDAGYRIRTFDRDHPAAELERLWRVASDAFEGAFLYSPIAAVEFTALYERLLPVARPELILMAEHGSEPVGFCFGVPDVLQANRGEAIDTVILKTLAVVRRLQGRGLGVWLFDSTIAAARALGYRRVINALMHEANSSRKLGQPQMRDFRRYTLFARHL
jgi:GNAT superfamily N-acetyltransferase